MAFEEVKEVPIDEYWNPEKVGEVIEGNVYEIAKDQWNNKRIVLDLGDDEEGEMITTTLPAHAHLKRFIPNLKIGDYIQVKLIKLIEPTPEELEEDPDRKPIRKYSVQKDPERAQKYLEE